MFVNSTFQVGVTQRVVATLVACAVVMFTIGAYNVAQAANLTNVSNTLTNSAPGELSGHTFAFTVPTVGGTAIAPGDTTTIVFDAAFADVTDIVDGDVTVTVNAVDVSGAATVDGINATDVTVTGITVAAGEEVVVAIADTRVTNPAKVLGAGIGDSYEFSISNGNDSGKTRVAIIDNVLVTAIVETTFDFVITGHATGTAINGDVSTGSTTATAIPFGTLAAGVPEILTQGLQVTTNAANGFVVTVESDGDLQSSTGATIDNFDEGSDVADTGTAWNAPVPTIGDDTSWGHWGMASEDGDLNSLGGFYSAEFSVADSYIAASTTPREVFHHDGPSDGTTTNIGTTTVGYQIEITSLQEAGDDYNTTLTYIATPTF